jgi:amino acid transporter
VLAQIAAAVFGPGTFGFYVIQAVTAAILILAANTSFHGFPMLVSVLARDRYAPASSTLAVTGWCSPTASSRWRSSRSC